MLRPRTVERGRHRVVVVYLRFVALSRGGAKGRPGESPSQAWAPRESLDADGRVVAQRVEWLGGTVPVFSRTYYEVPAPPPAARYRVSVFAFDFVQAAFFEAP